MLVSASLKRQCPCPEVPASPAPEPTLNPMAFSSSTDSTPATQLVERFELIVVGGGHAG